MIKTSNKKLLQKVNLILNELLVNIDGKETSKVIMESSKVGCPTIKVKNDNEEYVYMHSKYDPVREARELVNNIKIRPDIKHIFFIGTGLGYHINEVLSYHKEISYSIYEPNINVMNTFLSEVGLEKYKKNDLIAIFTDFNQVKSRETFLNKMGQNNLTITLPISEKLDKEKIRITMESILQNLKLKHSGIATEATFQKRWIINSLKNFPKLFETPNMLIDIDKKNFKGKPIILVAAGPSLTYEINHLKYISKNGLAYIFSVGSAINALIENDIIPHAACTYDPSDKNQVVFQKIKDKKINNLPLIFGSTVGFETLVNYPGPLLHMITSQDTVSANLLNNSKTIDIVLDSPSIAIVTFQLLTILEVSKVILVGQNFAYLNNERYAKGIDYDFIKNELSVDEVEKIITIDGVGKEEVLTSEDFLKMKQSLEYFIINNPQVDVINTTQYGAKIEGTSFKLLSEVISNELEDINLVNDDWYKERSNYELNAICKKLFILKEDSKKIIFYIEKNMEVLKKIEVTLKKGLIIKLERLYMEFDNSFVMLKENNFYSTILEPMIRVQNKVLSDESLQIKYEKNIRKKAKMILEYFGNFLSIIEINYNHINPIFNEMVEELKEKGVKIE